MFREWGQEIDGMRNADLRNGSRTMLRDSQKRYAILIEKMRDSEERMQPVLRAFRDQVLFLKQWTHRDPEPAPRPAACRAS